MSQNKQPVDQNGNVIGIGDTLVTENPAGSPVGSAIDGLWRFKVVSIDHLQGSGSAQLRCLFPVEPGWEKRWVSRSDLAWHYLIEAKETRPVDSNADVVEVGDILTTKDDEGHIQRYEVLTTDMGAWVRDLSTASEFFLTPHILHIEYTIEPAETPLA